MTRNDQEPDDRPWTEEQWERFMEKSDVRSAKFGELLETFIDHPDRDELIAHEMGWDRDELGDDDDVLCGNIVCCKKSLAAANECLQGLQSLRARRAVPTKVLDPLIREGKEVRALVEQHIVELRSRVWWQ